VRDCAKSRFGFLSETRFDNHWDESQGAAGLDGIRECLLHPLLRLQRYLLVEGAGAPQRQYCSGVAVAESVGASGRELITAIALAYEVQCRLCDAASIRARAGIT